MTTDASIAALEEKNNRLVTHGARIASSDH